MRFRILGVPLLLVAIAAPRSISAQTMITLEVPVNVTKLAPEVQKIRVMCNLNSEAIVPATAGGVPSVTALDEVPVVGGQVVSTLRVVFTFPAGSLKEPIGKSARYECSLGGVTPNGTGGFSDQIASTLPLYMKPPPPVIAGNFVW